MQQDKEQGKEVRKQYSKVVHNLLLDLDIVISINNLLKDSKSYVKLLESLWQYHKDDVNDKLLFK